MRLFGAAMDKSPASRQARGLSKGQGGSYRGRRDGIVLAQEVLARALRARSSAAVSSSLLMGLLM